MIRSKIVHIDVTGDAKLEIKHRDLVSNHINTGDATYLKTTGVMVNDLPCLSGRYCVSSKPVLLTKDNGVVLSVRHGNAAERYKLREGQEVEIGLGKPKKYWEQENAYSFHEIKKRSKGMSLEAYANFRPLFNDNDQFFRSSSPFDNAYGRARPVVQCIKKYHIRTIIDVADTKEDFHANLLKAHISSKKLLGKCAIYPIGDDSGLFSKEFEGTIKRALEIICENEGPFLIHCRAGKRRSGFICAILQGLAGMSPESIKADYMISYKNNNGVTRHNNRRRYEFLMKDTIGRILEYIDNSDLGSLRSSTILYLKRIGISERVIKEVMTKIVYNQKSPQ